MSEKTPAKPAPVNDVRTPIRVHQVRFVVPQDIPRKAATSSCATTNDSNRDRYEVLYLPWMRHFQITCTPAGDQEGGTLMIHESHVKNWIPLEAE